MKKENKKAKVITEYRTSHDGGKSWGEWKVAEKPIKTSGVYNGYYFNDMSTEEPKNIKEIRVFLKD